MNLYLCVFSWLGGKDSSLVRHTSGEKATQAYAEDLMKQGFSADMVLNIETTLLLSDGPIGIIQRFEERQ